MAEQKAQSLACRFCGQTLTHMFLDLGMSPLCQNRITSQQLNDMEPFYPLRLFLCDSCYLVQLPKYVEPSEIFRDYAYFSSYSASWLEHAASYVASVVDRFGLNESSRIVELASNDGYLLQNFVRRGMQCLGIEPAVNVAEFATERGIPTLTEFFGSRLAERVREDFGPADLIIGNNVLAHVPALNDFVEGIAGLLAPAGIVTMEFPHIVRLIDGNQFDTIYHEHFSYFSLFVAENVFSAHGMCIFDVEELPTHGGSLRIFACHQAEENRQISTRVVELRRREFDEGFRDARIYDAFAERVKLTKRNILDFLIAQRNAGKRIAGYGAPGKGNTLLNYCGIREDFLEFTVDASPHKQGTYTPGAHVPVYHPDRLREERPDFVLILPWNLREEISRQAEFIRDWGGQFVVPIPDVAVF